jgi:hypothetical protein
MYICGHMHVFKTIYVYIMMLLCPCQEFYKGITERYVFIYVNMHMHMHMLSNNLLIKRKKKMYICGHMHIFMSICVYIMM